eukprot:m.86480 g.86480  ORF g.86480 m.86480 type:complete len:969 (+) comp14878_c0_seq1:249-3155(+)
MAQHDSNGSPLGPAVSLSLAPDADGYDSDDSLIELSGLPGFSGTTTPTESDDGDSSSDEEATLSMGKGRIRSYSLSLSKRAWRYLFNFIMPKGKLSLFRGVFIPACLGLVGPTIMIYLSHVLSEAGLLLTLVMIALIGIINTLAVLGVSAIVTNGKMQSGGAYFLISRTLGAELGGSIGILLVVKHLIGAVYYLATVSEIFGLSTAEFTGTTSYSYQFEEGTIISSVGLLICVALAFLGLRGYSTVALLFTAIKIVTIVSVIGSLLFAPTSSSTPTDLHNVTIRAAFTGPSLTNLRSNLHAHEDNGNEPLQHDPLGNFLQLFSVVFAAFSGLSCGVNFTGEVRNPGRNIPRGLAYSVATGIALYVACGCIISLCVYDLTVLPGGARDVVLRTCFSEWIVLLGLTACCLGTTIVHFVSISTILLFMGNDGLFPFFKPFRFPFMRPSRVRGWRRWHFFVAWLLIQATIFAGSAAAVTSLLTITYLLFTSVINAALLTLSLLGAPSFRPRFRLYSRWSASLGIIIPLITMFGLDYQLSFVMIGVFALLFLFFTITAPPSDFGEIHIAIIYHQIRKYLLLLGTKRTTVFRSTKFWRPSLLLFETQNPEFLHSRGCNLVKFLDCVKKGGLYLVGSAVISDFDPQAVCQRSELVSAWHAFIRKERVKAMPVCQIARSSREAVQSLLFSTGLGWMRPNTLVLPWLGASTSITPVEYVNIMKDVMLTDLHLLIGINFEKMHHEHLTMFKKFMSSSAKVENPFEFEPDSNTMTIDVWAFPFVPPSYEGNHVWEDFGHSLNLALQLANTLLMNRFWKKNASMRVVVPVANRREHDRALARWQAYLGFIRIRAQVHVVVCDPSTNSHPAALRRRNSRRLQAMQDQISSAADEDAGVPLPLPKLYSNWFAGLTSAELFDLCRTQLLQQSPSTAVALVPLCPPPDRADRSVDYVTELAQLLENSVPTLFVHSSFDVIYTGL